MKELKMSGIDAADKLAIDVYKKFLLHDSTWMVDARNLPKDNEAWLKFAALIHITTTEERGERGKEEMALMSSLMHDLAAHSINDGRTS